MIQGYHSGLMECFIDGSTCIYGTLCPCYLNASNASALKQEDCSIVHCIFCYSPFWVRQRLKRQIEIQPEYCDDCLAITCCCPCAVCQDSREIHWKIIESAQKPLLEQA